jgi:hypothetical protein
LYHVGKVVAPDRIAAYALYNLSSSVNDPLKDYLGENYNPAIAYSAVLIEEMSADELSAGQRLSREMAKPGNLLKALDAYF